MVRQTCVVSDTIQLVEEGVLGNELGNAVSNVKS
jgi:hypothetical protein